MPSGEHGREQPDHSRSLSAAASSCTHDICITCSDHADIARVVELLPGGQARVETDGVISEVSVELLEVSVNEFVLAHAGVAIGKADPVVEPAIPARS